MIGSVCRARAATPIGAPAFTSIAADGDATLTCGVLENGHVLCWGDDLSQHAGVVSTGNVWLSLDREVLVQGSNAPLDGVRANGVFVGFANACAVRTDGTLWCWGPNGDAQLARPIDASASLATQIAFPF
jgi:hypothetical protein